MRIEKAHLFVMLDIALGPAPRPITQQQRETLASHAGSGGVFKDLMDDGSSWLFFDHTYADEHNRSQGIEILYADAPLGGTRLAVQPELGLGVLTYWKRLGAGKDSRLPDDADVVNEKLQADDDQRYLVDMVEQWGFSYDRVGRIFTFLSVQVDTDDLEEFVSMNATDIGRLFTGNQEDEGTEQLAAYAHEGNLSGRRFERVFIRWTDALAVYDSTTDLMDPATMRVVRLVESGILLRRLLREVAYDAEQTMREVRAWTPPMLGRPFKHAEHLRETFAAAELDSSIAPPVHSVEGERLLTQTLEAFEVPELREKVRASIGELERRLEWHRFRWFAFIGVAAFVANFVVSVVK
jgi:hypothetical protein